MKTSLENVKTSPPSPRPIERLLSPFQRFIHLESSGGIALIACTVVALVWTNSPWAASYHHLWALEFSIGIEGFSLSKDLHHWINDGLMAVFFFVVGLEIKRELLTGELASVRKATLPVAAAIGGMVVPASVYALLNLSGAGTNGWGIPMATDIAFAIGVMALLGKRVPLSLKVFITALAIADDLGAVLVIALFYTDAISLIALAVAGGFFATMTVLNLLHVRSPLPYALLGVGLWVSMLESGVHATIAGVLGAMTIPCRTHMSPRHLVARAQRAMGAFGDEEATERHEQVSGEQEAYLDDLESAVHRVQTPLRRLETALHPWISFVIMPVFALANAGVILTLELGDVITVPLGIILGLVLGKPVGIALFAWLAVKLNLAELPQGMSWRALVGGGMLAGIGFTMSLFIANLAFGEGPLLEPAKIAILAASLLAGLSGAGILALQKQGSGPEEETTAAST